MAISAARQWADDDVTVNCISLPSAIETSIDDLAAITVFLAGPAPLTVTGTTVAVGGSHGRYPTL